MHRSKIKTLKIFSIYFLMVFPFFFSSRAVSLESVNACLQTDIKSSQPFRGPYELVVCAIFHNEDFFLKEWIEFHKLMGVQHFYLYNNLSVDRYEDILRPYIEAGDVDLIDWPIEALNQAEYFHLLQIPAYLHALRLIQGQAKWAAFIDLDEFLFPVEQTSLIELLKDYEEYAGLAVNWQVYGTSWIDELPKDKLIIESFYLKSQEKWEMNKLVKLIVQPDLVSTIRNPHFFDYKEGFFAVNSSKEALEADRMGNQIVVDKVRINHYWFGSYQWFVNNKTPRREKWGIKLSPALLQGLILSCNEIKDDAISRFVIPLKQRLSTDP